jgi:4-aminobutyrate aminotransferase-like enzyme
VARTEETRAKTISTLASVENDQRESAVKTAKELQDIVQGSQGMRQPPSRF